MDRNVSALDAYDDDELDRLISVVEALDETQRALVANGKVHVGRLLAAAGVPDDGRPARVALSLLAESGDLTEAERKALGFAPSGFVDEVLAKVVLPRQETALVAESRDGAPELPRPRDSLATADMEKAFSRWRIGPASRAGFYMAVLAVGLALSAADPLVAAAKGGRVIALLHVLGTGLFARMLLLEPWRIHNHKLRLAAAVLGTSTFLEAWFADYPWHTVQFLIRSGCGVVVVSMASLVIFSFRPKKRMKALFFIGLLVGATGSLIVSVGALLATRVLYPLDAAGAVANLIVAVGAWGLGLRCLGLRVLPIPGKAGPSRARTLTDHLSKAGDLLEFSDSRR